MGERGGILRRIGMVIAFRHAAPRWRRSRRVAPQTRADRRSRRPRGHAFRRESPDRAVRQNPTPRGGPAPGERSLRAPPAPREAHGRAARAPVPSTRSSGSRRPGSRAPATSSGSRHGPAGSSRTGPAQIRRQQHDVGAAPRAPVLERVVEHGGGATGGARPHRRPRRDPPRRTPGCPGSGVRARAARRRRILA